MNAVAEAMAGPPVLWQPNPGPQTRFLASGAFEALYGGAAGGGKSDALLMGALRYVHKPSYRALLLRRTMPELIRSLIPKSFLRYPALGATPVMSPQPMWKFPSGAVIEFGHLQHDHDVHKYQSAEYQHIGFDELTSFLMTQYVYMKSRLRGTDGIPVCIRGGTNPGGEGHEWVQDMFAPWLRARDPSYEGKRAEPGETLYYISVKDNNGNVTREWVSKGTPKAMSIVFFPALVKDNPHIDPGYETILEGLDRVNRAQLLEGDWLIRPAAGMYFKRQWFRFLDAAPMNVVRRVRRWDLASTEAGGDWTVGVRMALTEDDRYVIEDVVRGRWRPEGVRQSVMATAEMDGKETTILIPQDPGQAGVDQRDAYAKMLAGYNVRFLRETGDKTTRAQPFSAQCEARRVDIVRATWNEPFMQCLEAFGEEGVHDDDVDAAAGAFNLLALKQPVTLGNEPVNSGARRGTETASPRGDFDDEDEDDGYRSRSSRG